MSLNPLALAGWENLSIWGYDERMDGYFAELTRNGGDDSNGPEVWLAPAIPSEDALARLIAEKTGAAVPAVREAMDAGRRWGF